jgi:hypothetical protein
LERLSLLPLNEQRRLLALREKEEAESNDDELNAKEEAKAAQHAKDAIQRKGSITGNALNGLTAEEKSEKLLGLGGKRNPTKRTKRSKRSKPKRKTQKKSHSRRSRHAR